MCKEYKYQTITSQSQVPEYNREEQKNPEAHIP